MPKIASGNFINLIPAIGKSNSRLPPARAVRCGLLSRIRGLNSSPRLIGNPSGDPAFVIQLLFLTLMKRSPSIHQKLNTATAQDAGADRGIVIPAARSNIVPSVNQQFCHCLCSKFARHYKVTDLVTTKIRYLARSVSLMPVGRD